MPDVAEAFGVIGCEATGGMNHPLEFEPGLMQGLAFCLGRRIALSCHLGSIFNLGFQILAA